MALADYRSAPDRALDRPLIRARISSEALIFIGLVLASVVAHFYALGQMALHHDESIHAWMSWRFFTGDGSFTCAGGRTAPSYCYDPVYHGPALYVLTLVSYFLFGDGDAQARIPQAAAGVAMVASVWMLRPYLGRNGTLLTALLLAFTPSLLYYTRFARHDGLMVLWELWMVIGALRFIDSGKARWLYLLAAAAALAVATHELYYILGFIFGGFLIIRVLAEWLPTRRQRERRLGPITLQRLLGVVVVIGLIVELLIITGVWSGRLTARLNADGVAWLFIALAGSALGLSRLWDPRPVLLPRLSTLWREQRGALGIAAGIFLGIYICLYSVFFSDPLGILDGAYRGLQYWLGSQQEYARGDQPWYYYFMLMTLYEPLAFFGAIASVAYLFSRRAGPPTVMPSAISAEAGDVERGEAAELTVNDIADAPPTEAPLHNDQSAVWRPYVPIYPLLLVFWFFTAFAAFSWAGEKMPWLNSHIALPANLLLGWTLARLYGRCREAIGELRRDETPDLSGQLALIPLALVLSLIALGVAVWRFSPQGESQVALAGVAQGIVPLAIGGGLLYALFSIAQRLGARVVLSICGLTLAVAAGAYTLRSTWLVVYNHPDTPTEPLVYVQSAPDVPIIVKNVRELAINQTRNRRDASDPIGGLSMPVIMDNGDSAADGEGSLAWPFQWYLRDFKRLESRDAKFFREATADSYLVKAADSDAQILAPVVLVSRQHADGNGRAALEANYVKTADAKLNWWFPEGNKCQPAEGAYKRFYFAYPGSAAAARKACGESFDTSKLPNALAPLLWPLDRSHWDNTWKYLLYRELPAPLTLDGREMQVWVRRDLAGGADGAPTLTSGAVPLKLSAEQIVGEPGTAPGQLSKPRGITMDDAGNTYVADTDNHRVVIYDKSGAPVQTIGSLGSGDGQFNEPRGVAVDKQGNIYVADTWNARIVKLDKSGKQLLTWGQGSQDLGNGRKATITDGTEAGNQAAPLGFFGPRSVALDPAGNVYIADTGNKRIVVTDQQGNYLYQWGFGGASPGAFSEPIGLAIDAQGRVYVGDTWNSRVQVFGAGAEGQIDPKPVSVFRVPEWKPQSYDDPFIGAGGGYVFVGIPTADSVAVLNADGREVLRFGGAGQDSASFGQPGGISVTPEGAVLVADRTNGRVLRFRIPIQGL